MGRAGLLLGPHGQRVCLSHVSRVGTGQAAERGHCSDHHLTPLPRCHPEAPGGLPCRVGTHWSPQGKPQTRGGRPQRRCPPRPVLGASGSRSARGRERPGGRDSRGFRAPSPHPWLRPSRVVPRRSHRSREAPAPSCSGSRHLPQRKSPLSRRKALGVGACGVRSLQRPSGDRRGEAGRCPQRAGGRRRSPGVRTGPCEGDGRSVGRADAQGHGRAGASGQGHSQVNAEEQQARAARLSL